MEPTSSSPGIAASSSASETISAPSPMEVDIRSSSSTERSNEANPWEEFSSTSSSSSAMEVDSSSFVSDVKSDEDEISPWVDFKEEDYGQYFRFLVKHPVSKEEVPVTSLELREQQRFFSIAGERTNQHIRDYLYGRREDPPLDQDLKQIIYLRASDNTLGCWGYVGFWGQRDKKSFIEHVQTRLFDSILPRCQNLVVLNLSEAGLVGPIDFRKFPWITQIYVHKNPGLVIKGSDDIPLLHENIEEFSAAECKLQGFHSFTSFPKLTTLCLDGNPEIQWTREEGEALPFPPHMEVLSIENCRIQGLFKLSPFMRLRDVSLKENPGIQLEDSIRHSSVTLHT